MRSSGEQAVLPWTNLRLSIPRMRRCHHEPTRPGRARDARLQTVRIHDLRATLACRLRAVGVSMEDIRARLRVVSLVSGRRHRYRTYRYGPLPMSPDRTLEIWRARQDLNPRPP